MGKRVSLAELAADELYEPGSSSTDSAEAEARPDRTVPISSVELNPLNKRQPGEDDEVNAVADTIREFGMILPLVVCSAQAYLGRFPQQAKAIGSAQWVVLIGNRRLQAARLVPLDEVPIIVNDDRVASMYEVMLIENNQRRALPELLEAEAMAEVMAEKKISQRELARRIGKSHTYIAQRLALLNLVPELRAALEQGELKIEQARTFGELRKAEQKQIVAAGKPYRLPSGNGVATPAARRSIRASTPAVAAESIRKKFSAEELAELIRLLTEDLQTAEN